MSNKINEELLEDIHERIEDSADVEIVLTARVNGKVIYDSSTEGTYTKIATQSYSNLESAWEFVDGEITRLTMLRWAESEA